MVGNERQRAILSWANSCTRSALAAGCLAVLILNGGCGTSVSPEQEAAIKRIQYLGGRVSFTNGGYKVDMIGTQVEDNDLAQFQHIKNLKAVDLQGTRVTDDGLKELESIKTLVYVRLSRTRASRDAVKQLKEALPNADIEY
jgi:hypothetical protein